jgi:tRNA A-37 threonylcarbamoyl transferase component Bud32
VNRVDADDRRPSQDLLPVLTASLSSIDEVADVVKTALLAGVSMLPIIETPVDGGLHILELHSPDLIEPLTISGRPLGTATAGLMPVRLSPLDDAAATRLRGFLEFAQRSEGSLFGRVLGGRYRVENVLGHGAIGTVYRAHHIALDKPVAVKVLHDRWREDPTFSARFQREARAASRLDHPGIMRVLDFGEEGSVLYMVMELLEGRTVEEIVEQRGALPAANALEIVARVGDALAVAHAHGVVHRDIKAENVIIVGERVVVCDFGIATMSNTTSVTIAGEVCGTPDYMAPEQARGEAVGPTADVYACGVMLYRLLTAKLPFTRSTALATALAHVTDPIPSARQIVPALDARIDAALQQILAKDPKKRPADGAALATLVRALGRPAETTSRRPPMESRSMERVDVRTALIAGLGHGEPLSRIQALSALRRMRAIDRDTVPLLAKIIDIRSAEDDEVRAAAAAALVDAVPDAQKMAVDALVTALSPSHGAENFECNMVVETIARALIDLTGEEGRRMVVARAEHAHGTLKMRLRSVASATRRTA